MFLSGEKGDSSGVASAAAVPWAESDVIWMRLQMEAAVGFLVLQYGLLDPIFVGRDPGVDPGDVFTAAPYTE